MDNKIKEPAQSANCTSSTENINTTTYDDTTKKQVCQDKLDKEYKAAKLSQKGKAVGPSVLNVLKDFCDQNAEFAQAIMQSDKTVKDCIEYTVSKAGNSISDIEVYRKAVSFYFPGATVHFNMTIDLGDEGFSNNTTVSASTKDINLSLDSFLDF